MKRILPFFIVVLLSASTILAQTVIFSEDFESGTPDPAWELYRAGEEPIQAVPMASAPAALSNGGSYVGMIHDADVSYTGAAIAIAGDVNLQNYTIEADVYCYVFDPGGSAYTGLVAYADSSVGIYYKLVADFDASNRFRLYNNVMDTTFQYTFHHSIPATGLYSTSAWHHMKLQAETIGDTITAFSCWFDTTFLGQYIDDGDYQVGNGKFGLFSFQMDADGLAGYFDNIVVTSGVSGIDGDNGTNSPREFVLQQNYPNPFNPNTNIVFNLQKADDVRLTIYNASGELIKVLTNNHYSSGRHELIWDATDQSGNKVSAGTYLYTIRTSDKTETRKMVLLK